MEIFNFFRRYILITLVACVSVFLDGCRKDPDPVVERMNSEGFGLYWHHEVFSEQGRGLLFGFSALKGTQTDYDLKFSYDIKGNIIRVRLVDVIEKGPCLIDPGFTPNGTSDCQPDGTIFIPDKSLSNGDYVFELVTKDFKVTSRLNVTSEKVSLDIPTNEHFSSTIPAVFPIPEGILLGSLIYSGSENEKFARSFINELSSLGIKPATLPDLSYRHLDVKQNGNLMQRYWEPDNHSISLLYHYDDARPVFELARKYLGLSEQKLQIYLYTSQGDQARFAALNDIMVRYAN